ncbi:MAG: hypothetical protein JWO89_3501 [Verrucomicrobiaceae bacterium]|nr:hypothetical protein [Verrucomicrobiaceae bacterium]MDB6119057.1 hypothetical protein [Verrucomicrobiaceae bacterium]
MSRIIGTLIVAGGLAGSYFVYQDFAAKQQQKHNHFADDVKQLMIDHGAESQLEGRDAPWFGNDGTFFRILGLMHDAERHKYSAADTIKNAVAGIGARPGEAKLIQDMLADNYRLAKQMGVFDDMSNMLRMENGKPPISKAEGWEDEPLTVGHLLSPVIAPEASLSFANVLLMPKCMRDMQSDDLNGFTPDMAKKWLSERIITPESHAAIMEVLSAKKF